MSPEITNALTVDLEEWYHGLTRTNPRPDLWPGLARRSEVAARLLLDLLAEASVRATFFVLGDLAQNAPDLIRAIAQAGHELASHGYSHRPVDRLTPAGFREDLQNTRRAIQSAVEAPLLGYRAPYFSINRSNAWAFEVLAEEGYRYDSSVFPMRTILYGYPGASHHPYRPLGDDRLVEYPVAMARLAGVTLPVAGGFYLRVLPYPLVRWGLRRLNRQGYPAVLYLHPWELDLAQPRIPVSPREQLTHYSGRASLPARLRRLFRDFELAPLGEVHRQWLSAHEQSPNRVNRNCRQ